MVYLALVNLSFGAKHGQTQARIPPFIDQYLDVANHSATACNVRGLIESGMHQSIAWLLFFSSLQWGSYKLHDYRWGFLLS